MEHVDQTNRKNEMFKVFEFFRLVYLIVYLTEVCTFRTYVPAHGSEISAA